MGGRGNDCIAQSHERNFKPGKRAKQACESGREPEEVVLRRCWEDSDQLLNGSTEGHVTELTSQRQGRVGVVI